MKKNYTNKIRKILTRLVETQEEKEIRLGRKLSFKERFGSGGHKHRTFMPR